MSAYKTYISLVKQAADEQKQDPARGGTIAGAALGGIVGGGAWGGLEFMHKEDMDLAKQMAKTDRTMAHGKSPATKAMYRSVIKSNLGFARAQNAKMKAIRPKLIGAAAGITLGGAALGYGLDRLVDRSREK